MLNIQSTENIGVDSLKILIYGEPGSGKTTLAGTIDEPTLIISAEAGLLSLRNKKIDVVDISVDNEGKLIPKEERVNRLGQIYEYLLTDEARKKYKCIFIDSLSEINQNLLEQLNKEFPDRKDSLVMYGELSKRMRSLVKSFRDIPGYSVIFTALSEFDKDEHGQRFLGISLVGNFSNKISAYFDEVFYLHVDKENGDQRFFVTQKTEKLVAKDRSGSLDKIELPHLSAIFKKIRPQVDATITQLKTGEN